MANFSWTNAAGGDWSVATNWELTSGVGSPPPGINDRVTFGDLGTSYAVTVTTTVEANFLIYDTPQAISTTVAAGGLLHVNTTLESLQGIETITIAGTGAGGHVELTDIIVAAGSFNVSFDFANAGPTTLNTGVIQFDSAFGPGNTATEVITNVARGNEFVVGDLDFTGDTVAYDPVAHDLTVNGPIATVFTMSDVSLQSGFALAGGSFEIVNGNTIEAVICFTKGTRIATPHGEVPIEQLSIGDEVVTHSGKVCPITWIGTGCVLATRGQRTAATPVIIRKGAIADNEPYQDLRVTKGHSLYIDRVLIPVEFLVNHRSILWDDRAQEVSIYHIELEAHEVLIANGVAAESYRDDGNRWLFSNANVAWSFPPKEPCAPVLTGGPVVDAIWQRLLERSGTRPGFPLTDDPGLHLLVDGQRVDPRMATPDGRYVFRLQAAPNLVRIVSRAGAPSELGLSRDPRLLGIAVHRIAILDEVARRIVEAADTALRDGFHGYEPGEDIRWTNGNAGLPVDLFSACGGPLDIEITTAGATRYLDEGVPLAA